MRGGKGGMVDKIVVVKIFSKAKMTTAVAIKNVCREVKILKALFGHKNLVKIYDAYANATESMKESKVPDLLNMLEPLSSRRMDFEEFCAVAINPYQLETLEGWEQMAMKAFEYFEQEGNKVITIEELVQGINLASTAYSIVQEWIKPSDGGKLLNLNIWEMCNYGFWMEAKETFLAKRNLDSKKDVLSWDSMVGALLRIGEIQDAQKLFEEMPIRDIASWNNLFDGIWSLLCASSWNKEFISRAKYVVSTDGGLQICGNRKELIRLMNELADMHRRRKVFDP